MDFLLKEYDYLIEKYTFPSHQLVVNDQISKLESLKIDAPLPKYVSLFFCFCAEFFDATSIFD